MTTNDLPTPERIEHLLEEHEADLRYLTTIGHKFRLPITRDTIACLCELLRYRDNCTGKHGSQMDCGIDAEQSPL